MLRRFFLMMAVIFGLCLGNVPFADAGNVYDNIPGIVTRVYDGDTLTLQNNNGTYRIRLEGIDAPERRQGFGTKSRDYLYQMVRNKFVYAAVKEKDRYGRYIATIILNDIDVNAEMLKAGLAWHYKRYDDKQSYAMLEAEARRNKVGLWSEKNPMPPWEFRKRKAPAYK